MYKRTITYTDFNDLERTEDFYFNLTTSEIADMEMSTEGGLAERIRKIVQAKDMTVVHSIFKTIFAKSYGVKSDDGKRFIKSPELYEEFTQTLAYDKLYLELLSDPEILSDFLEGILPKDLREAIDTAPIRALKA